MVTKQFRGSPDEADLRRADSVEYTLTEPGRGLRVTVAEMCGWTQRYLSHMETARRRFDD
ncbi:winged helix-turn-helix transcriptional regulator [Streptomyces sp. HUAS TT7]|uniref:winged helix-turn-helix transcriptional regulator n=1 Tax=Streptomyces sp. HUAS TT7 TaxID=3447507 RepID=UPI003F65A533